MKLFLSAAAPHPRTARTHGALPCVRTCAQMGWQRGREGGVLLAEPNFTSRSERERLCQLMFEVFNLSGYYAADQAVLSLYALGKLSGTVVDVGYAKTGGWGGAVWVGGVGRGVGKARAAGGRAGEVPPRCNMLRC